MTPNFNEWNLMSKKTSPLLVVVTEDRYDMYGTSFRHKLLAKILQRQGGISNTVEPGTYEFNVMRKGFSSYATLHPHKES